MSAVEFPAVINSKIGAALGIILGSFNVEGSSVNVNTKLYRMLLGSSNSNPAKVDIASAFRIIPVSPLDRPLLGFQWKGKFFMDAVLPMGVSSACAIFELSVQRWSSVAFRKYI